MYIPLPLRLTFFFALIVAAALWLFGSNVYQTAEQNAYDNLRNLLKARAEAVQLGKDLAIAKGGPHTTDNIKALSSVDAFGNGGVYIQVWGYNSLGDWTLLAETANHPSTDPTTDPVTGLRDLDPAPHAWDQHAIDLVLNDSPDSYISEVHYQDQTIMVYTLINRDFGQMHVIQTAKSELETKQYLDSLRLLLSREAALVLAIGLTGSLIMTSLILASVRRMTSAARAISTSRDFSRRVPNKTLLGRDELATLADTFNQMLASLQEAHQQQKRFIADASHELRAPTTSIRCNLDLLATAPDLPADETRAALADARAEAERMGRLINDLLQLARSDEAQSNGTLPHQGKKIMPVELDSLLLDVYRQYQSLTGSEANGEQPLGPRVLLQHTQPVSVSGDADQLKQAIVALVDNAFKYTPQEGYISLSLTTNDSTALIKVSDTGIGIAPDDLPHIFERFYRANRARTRDRGGSGLGLAIVQSIVQQHGGTVEVESTPGKGSTFTLKIPLAPPSDAPASSPPDPA